MKTQMKLAFIFSILALSSVSAASHLAAIEMDSPGMSGNYLVSCA